MESSGTICQLRRDGKAATVTGVKDVLKLTKPVTKFGRHTGNDHYLDSSRLAHFISRWHAEIHMVTDSLGRRGYIIRDNGSVNGTYVNDVRIEKEQALKHGDTIHFGHTNGKNIKPGSAAPQNSSEFKFLFEEVPVENGTDHGVKDKDDSSDEDTYTPSGGARAKSAKNTSQGKGASETARNFKDSPSAPARNFRAGGPAAPSTSKKGGTLDKRKNEPSALREELKKGKAARRESASNLKGQGAKRKAPAAGKMPGRKKKRTDSSGADSELEDTKVTWHVDGDSCASHDCIRPDDSEVDWVQCDDCDAWYHAVCAGCDISLVNDDNAEFHCGCN